RKNFFASRNSVVFYRRSVYECIYLIGIGSIFCAPYSVSTIHVRREAGLKQPCLRERSGAG
ncbi:MAG TPA: hypothetical protein VEF33_06920, partial [Syntrophales bacterium]|nr:hypothetical protein [Syntrophales bacterium]